MVVPDSVEILLYVALYFVRLKFLPVREYLFGEFRCAPFTQSFLVLKWFAALVPSLFGELVEYGFDVSLVILGIIGSVAIGRHETVIVEVAII